MDQVLLDNETEVEKEDLDEQKGEGKDRHAQVAYALYRKSFSNKRRQAWVKEVKQNRRFIRSDQWTPEQKQEMEDSGMIPVVINETLQNMRHLCSFVTAASPGFVVTPIGGQCDPLVADIWRACLEKIGNDNFVEDVSSDVAWDSKVDGVGWFVIDRDETRKPSSSIIIRREDALKIHVDPNSKDKYYRDAEWILFVDTITRREAKNVWGLKEGEMGPPVDFADFSKSTEIEDGDYEENVDNNDLPIPRQPVYLIEAWIRRDRVQLYVVNKTTGKVDPFNEGMSEARKHVQTLKMNEPLSEFGVVPRKLRDVTKITVVGAKTQSVEINPLGRDFWGEPIIPLIPVPNIRIEGPYHYADVSLLTGPQMERNKRRSQLIYYAAVSSNSPWIFAKGAVDRDFMEKHGSKPGVMIEYDPTRQKTEPKRLQPTRMPEALITLEESSRDMLRYLIGLNDAVMGIPPTKDASGRLVLALQEYATAGMKPFIKQLEISMSMMGRVLMSVIQQTWKVPDIIRVRVNPQWDFNLRLTPYRDMGDEASLMEVYKLQRQAMMEAVEAQNLAEIIFDPTSGEFDVRVSAGSTMPANRMARLDMAMELFKLGIYDELAVLHYVDDPVKFDVIKRRKEMFHQMAMMRAMEDMTMNPDAQTEE